MAQFNFIELLNKEVKTDWENEILLNAVVFRLQTIKKYLDEFLFSVEDLPFTTAAIVYYMHFSLTVFAGKELLKNYSQKPFCSVNKSDIQILKKELKQTQNIIYTTGKKMYFDLYSIEPAYVILEKEGISLEKTLDNDFNVLLNKYYEKQKQKEIPIF